MITRGNNLSGAWFSEDERYRYRLWRRWNESPGRACFIMLNPSTADESANDPTVERCERRARAMGYGGLIVVNLFALRSTDPAALRKVADPVGPYNDEAITEAAGSAIRSGGIVICAWGQHGRLNRRGAIVYDKLRERGFAIHYLKLGSGNMPSHPLYLPYTLTPELWV